MKPVLVIVFAATLLVGPFFARWLAAASPSPSATAMATTPVSRLSGGAPTLDDLLGRFVAALGANDRAALEALRVTEAEYRGLIVPGNVKPGDPPQVVGAEAGKYFFDVMDTKSAYHRDALRKRFAGKKLTIREVKFEKGVEQYAGHRAHKRLVLTVVDESGRTDEIHTGSIVERDEQFKFMSFIRD